jgi:uncharacterized membrane-anchored protein
MSDKPNYLILNNEPINVELKQTPERYNKDNGEIVELVNGSIDKNIVVNIDNREAIPEEGDETKKILDTEREEKREMYIRHSRMLYPEKENWIIELAVDAFMRQEEKGIDILTHKFKDVNEIECVA